MEEIKEIKELYKMNAEKLKNILEKKKITERIVSLFEKSQYLKKEDLEKMLINKIPREKEKQKRRNHFYKSLIIS